MTKEQVNIAVINGLKNKGIFIGNISLEVLEAFAGIMYEALTIHSVVVPKGTLCEWKSHNYEVINIGMCGKCNGMSEINQHNALQRIGIRLVAELKNRNYAKSNRLN